MAELSEDLKADLSQHLAAAASVHKPVDMIASATEAQYAVCAEKLLASDEVDALLAIFVPPIITDSRDVAEAIAAAAKESGKPVVACFMGRHGVEDATGTSEAAQFPSYAFPEAAVQVLARAADYRHLPSARPASPPTPVPPSKMTSEGVEEADISILEKSGHLYFAAT